MLSIIQTELSTLLSDWQVSTESPISAKRYAKQKLGSPRDSLSGNAAIWQL